MYILFVLDRNTSYNTIGVDRNYLLYNCDPAPKKNKKQPKIKKTTNAKKTKTNNKIQSKN